MCARYCFDFPRAFYVELFFIGSQFTQEPERLPCVCAFSIGTILGNIDCSSSPMQSEPGSAAYRGARQVDRHRTYVVSLEHALQEFHLHRLLQYLLPDSFVIAGSAIAVHLWDCAGSL